MELEIVAGQVSESRFRGPRRSLVETKLAATWVHSAGDAHKSESVSALFARSEIAFRQPLKNRRLNWCAHRSLLYTSFTEQQIPRCAWPGLRPLLASPLLLRSERHGKTRHASS
jgi:hypothetical protein